MMYGAFVMWRALVLHMLAFTSVQIGTSTGADRTKNAWYPGYMMTT